MALKTVIHELCRFCGEVAATNDGESVVVAHTHCPQVSAGPPSPPRRYRAADVTWVPAAARERGELIRGGPPR